jgi:hypothetical protein
MKNHNSWVRCWREFFIESCSWRFGLAGGGCSGAFNGNGANAKRSQHWGKGI